jgi:chromosome segregation ATPase
MMEKDLKEVIDDKDERLRELEEASHASDTRNRQLEEMLAAERDKSMKLQSKVNELEETGLQLSSAREEAARGERDAALMDKEALGVRLTASEARVKELEREAASRAVQDKAMEQRLYTLEATVTLQQKEVEQAKLREGQAVGRLEDVEERLREAEAESNEFESRGEDAAPAQPPGRHDAVREQENANPPRGPEPANSGDWGRRCEAFAG